MSRNIARKRRKEVVSCNKKYSSNQKLQKISRESTRNGISVFTRLKNLGTVTNNPMKSYKCFETVVKAVHKKNQSSEDNTKKTLYKHAENVVTELYYRLRLFGRTREKKLEIPTRLFLTEGRKNKIEQWSWQYVNLMNYLYTDFEKDEEDSVSIIIKTSRKHQENIRKQSRLKHQKSRNKNRKHWFSEAAINSDPKKSGHTGDISTVSY